MEITELDKFIQDNSPDGGFLQSEEWRKFQESTGKKTFNITSTQPSPYKGEGDLEFWANVIEHALPVVGKYFYVPRGPVIPLETGMAKLFDLAKENNIDWIRFDANSLNIRDIIRKNWRVVKAPHDMQPREVFIIDIAKSEEELLAGMKAKTRYNIRLAEKKEIKIFETREKKHADRFCDLVKITAKRDGITSHPESYYRKMFEAISGDFLKLYVAEYEGKIIAANIVIFYGHTATYIHGASDNEHRNVMAPYLLQWRQISDAKKLGCVRYDFGGVKTGVNNSWTGITKFKTGFSLETKAIEFPGSYDIVINPWQYGLYRIIQKVKSFL